MIDPKLLDELEALKRAAGKGDPWRLGTSSPNARYSAYVEGVRNALPRLIAEIRRLQKELTAAGNFLDADTDIVNQKNAEIRRLQEVEARLLSAHGKALPPNWVYTDSETTIDLLIAEILTLRHEKERLQEAERAAKDLSSRSDSNFGVFTFEMAMERVRRYRPKNSKTAVWMGNKLIASLMVEAFDEGGKLDANCRNCGHRVNSGWAFCCHCGEASPWLEAITPTLAAALEMPAAEVNPGPC